MSASTKTVWTRSETPHLPPPVGGVVVEASGADAVVAVLDEGVEGEEDMRLSEPADSIRIDGTPDLLKIQKNMNVTCEFCGVVLFSLSMCTLALERREVCPDQQIRTERRLHLWATRVPLERVDEEAHVVKKQCVALYKFDADTVIPCNTTELFIDLDLWEFMLPYDFDAWETCKSQRLCRHYSVWTTVIEAGETKEPPKKRKKLLVVLNGLGVNARGDHLVTSVAVYRK